MPFLNKKVLPLLLSNNLVYNLANTWLVTLYTVWQNAKTSFYSSLTKRKITSHLANCYISSFTLSHLVQTRVNGELTQQDGSMTKRRRVRLGMHSLAPHFFVILPSWVFQLSCCVSSLMAISGGIHLNRSTCGSGFSTPRRQRSNSPPEGPTRQIPHSPGTESNRMPEVCPGEGLMLKFPFDRRITQLVCQFQILLGLDQFVRIVFAIWAMEVTGDINNYRTFIYWANFAYFLLTLHCS